jgi:hypothetical protein
MLILPFQSVRGTISKRRQMTAAKFRPFGLYIEPIVPEVIG